MTAERKNSPMLEPYKGEEEIVVGIGIGLPVLNSGSTIVFYSPKPFKLIYELHCPATSYLISIQRFFLFCFFNVIKCWFELTATHCFVKDIRRLISHFLIQFKVTKKVKKSTAFHGLTANYLTTWHHRLGHPSFLPCL